MRAVPRSLYRALALTTLTALAAFGLTVPAADAAVVGNPIVGPGGKCVDVAGDDTGVNGAAVQLWDCQSAAADQHYTWTGSALTAIGRCLDITSGGTANAVKLQLWDCNGTGAQQWTFNSDGSVRALGKCMDVSGGSTADGAAVQLWTCNGTGAQKFTLTAAGDLVNTQANKCVDVQNVATANGSKLHIWTCNGASNQKWHR
jgi:hypothetical protein